jgi:hypothetical protein
MKNNFLQVCVCVLLIALSIVVLNPMHLWMPDMVHMGVLAALLAAFAAFAAFVLKEQAHDEREVMLRMQSGRIGYLLGAAVLVLGVVYEGLHGTPDSWLIIALLVMLIGKLGAHFYTDCH